VSRAAFLDFVNGSVLGSAFTRYKSPALVNLDLTPTFTATLLAKDFELGLDAGRQLHVPLPVAALTQQLVQEAVGRGHGAEDFAALLIEQARRSGLEPRPEEVAVDDGLAPDVGATGSAATDSGAMPSGATPSGATPSGATDSGARGSGPAGNGRRARVVS
jgi:hypothetical protein